MRALLLGARGAVGRVIHRELTSAGHLVTPAGRTASGDAGADLRGDLALLARLAATHDVIINAAGIERPELAAAAGATPFVDISATGAYLDRLRGAGVGPVVLGAGLAPGLSTILASSLPSRPGDDLDIFIMLGSGEQHGPAAVAWTQGLVGAAVYQPPEGGTVLNFRESHRETSPDGRTRRYLRADFPDHLLLAPAGGVRIRSYLALDSPAMTAAFGVVGRLPMLRGMLRSAPHIGSDAWHIVARNRRTGERRHAAGTGQSEATGRLTALAAIQAATLTTGVVTMADLVTLDDAVASMC